MKPSTFIVGDISDDTTVIRLARAVYDVGDFVTIDGEIVKITSANGAKIVVDRAQLGTTAVAHNRLAPVSLADAADLLGEVVSVAVSEAGEASGVTVATSVQSGGTVTLGARNLPWDREQFTWSTSGGGQFAVILLSISDLFGSGIDTSAFTGTGPVLYSDLEDARWVTSVVIGADGVVKAEDGTWVKLDFATESSTLELVDIGDVPSEISGLVETGSAIGYWAGVATPSSETVDIARHRLIDVYGNVVLDFRTSPTDANSNALVFANYFGSNIDFGAKQLKYNFGDDIVRLVIDWGDGAGVYRADPNSSDFTDNHNLVKVIDWGQMRLGGAKLFSINNPGINDLGHDVVLVTSEDGTRVLVNDVLRALGSDELIRVTAISGNNVSLERGYNSTTTSELTHQLPLFKVGTSDGAGGFSDTTGDRWWSVDWLNCRLLAPDATSANAPLDWLNRKTRDRAGVTSVDWQNRKLGDTASNTAVDWQNGLVNTVLAAVAINQPGISDGSKNTTAITVNRASAFTSGDIIKVAGSGERMTITALNTTTNVITVTRGTGSSTKESLLNNAKLVRVRTGSTTNLNRNDWVHGSFFDLNRYRAVDLLRQKLFHDEGNLNPLQIATIADDSGMNVTSCVVNDGTHFNAGDIVSDWSNSTEQITVSAVNGNTLTLSRATAGVPASLGGGTTLTRLYSSGYMQAGPSSVPEYLAVDWDADLLFDNNGVLSFDWQRRGFFDIYGNLVAQYYSSDGFSIHYPNAGPGATAKVAIKAGVANDSTGMPSVNFNERTLRNSAGDAVGSWGDAIAGAWVNEGDVAEYDLPSLTWTGGVAPSGTISAKCRRWQVGKLITLQVKITASVAGTAVTAVSFDVPGGYPGNWSSNPANEIIAIGQAIIGATNNGVSNVGVIRIADETGSGGFKITISATAVAAKYVWATLQYFAQ